MARSASSMWGSFACSRGAGKPGLRQPVRSPVSGHAGVFLGVTQMDTQPSGSEQPPKQPHHAKHVQPAHHPTHTHHVRPIDPGYRLVVRITLWVIAGTVLVGLCIWWMST